MQNLDKITCSKCLEDKPISEFRKDSYNSTGYHSHCNTCSNLNQRKYYHDNIEYSREYARNRYLENAKKISDQRKIRRQKKKEGETINKGGAQKKRDLNNQNFLNLKELQWKTRGIKNFTYVDYVNMQEKQGFVCYICRKPPSDKRNLCVDHNHKTGKVRALLCNNCNNGIGKLGDDIELLQRAINYLKLFDNE